MKLFNWDARGLSFNEGGKYFDFVIWRNYYGWRVFIYIAVKVPGSQRWIRKLGGLRTEKEQEIL